MIEKRKVRIMMVNTNNLIIIIMKTTKNYLVFGVLTLCSLFFLAGCNSDGKLRESLNEYVNDMKHQYFPSGKFVFDENVKDNLHYTEPLQLLPQFSPSLIPL